MNDNVELELRQKTLIRHIHSFLQNEKAPLLKFIVGNKFNDQPIDDLLTPIIATTITQINYQRIIFLQYNKKACKSTKRKLMKMIPMNQVKQIGKWFIKMNNGQTWAFYPIHKFNTQHYLQSSLFIIDLPFDTPEEVMQVISNHSLLISVFSSENHRVIILLNTYENQYDGLYQLCDEQDDMIYLY